MQALGKEWTKLVVPTQGQHGVQDTTGGPVPSMGSTMKVGSAPTRMPGLYVSSPMKAMSGNAAERRDETIFSTFLSASVTMSTAAAPSQSALFCSGTEQPKERRFEPVGEGGRQVSEPTRQRKGEFSHGVQLSLVPVSSSAGLAASIIRPAS
jgi:hypothetical protein